MKKIYYATRVNRILKNLSKYHKKFYAKNTFSGPSIYFHKKALLKSDKQCEYIYAALTSWGMHRMGKKGAKMTDFRTFQKSVNGIKSEINQLKNKRLESLTDEDFDPLEKIFKNIKIMASATTIIGNSKVMAHLLPKIIPPIDREYTLYFMKKSIVNNMDKEWDIFKIFIQKFFLKVAADRKFKKQSDKWINNKEKFPLDTSIPKIIDNLIIGAKK